jgi:mRNA-degrading endonuclease toxin of MazEF toxin-antitoxin module
LNISLSQKNGKIIPSLEDRILKPAIITPPSKKSAIDLFQVRSVSEQRLSRKIGNVHKAILDRCKRSLDIVFEIQH